MDYGKGQLARVRIRLGGEGFERSLSQSICPWQIERAQGVPGNLTRFIFPPGSQADDEIDLFLSQQGLFLQLGQNLRDGVKIELERAVVARHSRKYVLDTVGSIELTQH